MLGIPSLSEVIRTTDNQRKYRQLTGAGPFDPINWLDAEREAQAMQPPPEAPMDPGQARLNATTVNPLTGRREWKPAKFGGPLPGLSPSPGLPVSPSSGDAPQWDAQPVGFGGPPGPARNPRGSGADPFDPNSKFANGQYFAEGGEVDGPGGPKDDLIPAMLSDGEFIMPAEAVKFFGLDKLNKMKEKAKEGLMEMKMPNAEGRMPNDRGMMPMNMAEGGSPWVEMLPGRMQATAAEDARFSEDVQAQLAAAGRVFATPDPVPGPGTEFARNWKPSAPLDPMTEGWRSDVTQRANAVLALPMVPTGAPMGFAKLPSPQEPFAPDPQALAELRQRRDLIRGGMITPTMEPQPMTATFAPRTVGQAPSSPAPFLAPWEKDAIARQSRQQELIPGMNRTQSRRFASSPQGAGMLMAQKDRALDRTREDARNAIKDQQEAEDRRLRMAEFQQRGDYYKRQAAAGDRAAELQVKQYELDVLKNEQEEKRRNTTPELKAVPTPDGRGVVYYSGNQLASGVMPTGNDAAVLTREQMDALDVEVDRVVDGKISYKKRGGGNPVLRDVTQPGQIAPTTYQFNPQTRQWEPPAIAGAAPAAPAAQSPRARNAPPPAAHITALKANPQAAADFDAKYGAGAAAKILGTK